MAFHSKLKISLRMPSSENKNMLSNASGCPDLFENLHK